MHQRRTSHIALLLMAVSVGAIPTVSAATRAMQPRESLGRQCQDAMRRATRFMVEKVSTRGGYVWQYLPDLSRRWGEMEAYDTMIWIQPPGTTTMGHLFLDAYRATGDEYYYRAAGKVGGALMRGQLECGGWHYMIDFGGERSLRRWYDTIGKNAWRLEEFQHYYGNATFDDQGTIDAARLLLRLYLEKLDPAFKPSLDRAIGFVLASQYANGGWPQRYPRRSEFSHHGRPDYTSYVTFNDGVVWENVNFLIACYATLGESRLLDPIQRGMNVYLLTQQAAPQAGWAQQYTPDLKPAGARTYEPEALAPEYTAQHVQQLMRFYRLTGDGKYLARIPEALDWLESCRLPESLTEGGRTHPTFVEIGTNQPLFAHRRGSNVVNGGYYVDHDSRNLLAHYNGKRAVDLAGLRREYEALKVQPVADVVRDSPLRAGVAPAGRRAEWQDALLRSQTRDDPSEAATPSEEDVRRILSALDQEGRWLSTQGMTSHPYAGDGAPGPADDRFAAARVGDETDTSPFPDQSGQAYISTWTYLRNMRALMGYVASSRD
jgi:PelA/Pel-15E family pectate lyase